MTNFEIISAITSNLKSILETLGTNFRLGKAGEKTIPASANPYAEITYAGESFENTLNRRPSYAEAAFGIKLVFSGRDGEELTREAARWVHLIRDALSVNAMNAGELTVEKPVSSVKALNADVESKEGRVAINYKIKIGYREQP